MEAHEEQVPITDTVLDEIEDDDEEDRWQPASKRLRRKDRMHAWRRGRRSLGL
ncbi:hypothetical protein [Paenibacillus hamazuiensis]|uniref:hypothetical protein n=1 Tax=Paenibacillus hamazuiensis TaxID=2936508 RepID=UPI00200C7A48|nr:hypothetical protein [Paenibacillus hamazuiensis]